MDVASRTAVEEDLPRLIDLYRPAIAEQVELREAWRVAEGLPEPIDQAFADLLGDPDSIVRVGLIDDLIFGFVWARIEPMLPQAGGEKIGVVRMVYVEEAARRVGVGEAMLTATLDELRGRGLTRFDAIVSPGHRLAKNFFESADFKARRITMYHRDSDQE
jgi:ribosomal protein S18 acetylase RimI-like enzyme